MYKRQLLTLVQEKGRENSSRFQGTIQEILVEDENREKGTLTAVSYTHLDVYKRQVSIRLITDHIRSATFMISDGIMPTNEGRGYVLRRLIRRAARHGRLLGIEGTFLAKLSAQVIESSKAGYPELEEKKEFIFRVLTNEENQFNKTIDQGLRILSDMEERCV